MSHDIFSLKGATRDESAPLLRSVDEETRGKEEDGRARVQLVERGGALPQPEGRQPAHHWETLAVCSLSADASLLGMCSFEAFIRRHLLVAFVRRLLLKK